MIFNSNELRNALKAVKPAIAKDEFKKFLNGVHFHCEDNKCDVVACDGYEIFVQHLTYESKTNENIEFTIPYFNVPKNSLITEITLIKDKCNIDFYNDFEIRLKVFEDEYIEYKNTYPKHEPVFSIMFDQKILKKALSNMKNPIVLDFYGELSPCVIRELKTENENIVLPLRKFEGD